MVVGGKKKTTRLQDFWSCAMRQRSCASHAGQLVKSKAIITHTVSAPSTPSMAISKVIVQPQNALSALAS